MTSLRHYVRLYCLIELQYIKSRMQYRTDFVISSIGILFMSVASLFVFKVIFLSVPRLAGLNFDELVFVYGFYLLAVTPLQIFFDHIWQLRYHVIQGTFIKYYLRPVNVLFYYMSDMIDIKGFVQLVVGIFILVYASFSLGIEWDFLRVLLLFASLFGAALVVISLMLMAASTAFWILDPFPVLALAAKIRDFGQYPMTIFDGFARFLFTYLIPTGFVAFYPAQLFLRPGGVSLIHYAAPFVGLVFFMIAYRVWSAGVNQYAGTGS